MPTLNKECKASRCIQFGQFANGYCEQHQHLAPKPWQSRRYSEGLKVYQSYKWQQTRVQVLREEPICRICSLYVSREVDHIKPLSQGGQPFERANLQALCKDCHRKKSLTESKFRG